MAAKKPARPRHRSSPKASPILTSPVEDSTPDSSAVAPSDRDGTDGSASSPDATHVLTKVDTVVGIGASAGGLEAFSQFLEALQTDTGMAFVLVQHLAPKHKSVLPELLAAKTNLPVVQVEDGMPLQSNRIFVIPPDKHMRIGDGVLRLSPRPQGPTQYLPIDAFLRSLAQWNDGNSIGVVLSGTATDGAAGLREIKAAGGITMVQDPSTARYDGMPRAAIAADHVDFVLSPAAIAAELSRIAKSPTARKKLRTEPEEAPVDGQLTRIFQMIRKRLGVDFSQYKTSTILRRLQRRMVLNKIEDIARYVTFLEQNPEELTHLHDDILIHVTCFFREADSFDLLRKSILPKLLEKRPQSQPLRMWVPGCSTGEEAYSLAICTIEALDDASLSLPIQIFATDVSEHAIQQARAGLYGDHIVADVSAERLRRFFTRTDASFRVNKMVRECCIFARQDVTRDPPFSRIDLVLCRNLLIYLSAQLQRRLISVFSYALKSNGYLVLGGAETVGAQAELFQSIDKTHRIYAKKSDDVGNLGPRPAVVATARVDAPAPSIERIRNPQNLTQDVNQALLARYAPSGVLVDGDLRIVQFRGQTGNYLEPSPGEASLNLLKMLRPGLLHGTRSALQEARKSEVPTRRNALPLELDGTAHDIDVVVVPLPATAQGRFFLVLFEEDARRSKKDAAAEKPRRRRDPASSKHAEVIQQLQQELSASREYMQSINQDLEAANEELQSANEEILSNNEELQSANEELDTAKEEMQSANEELNTVNDELRGRNEELSRANGDLTNLLASVQIAIVILDSNLRIRRFTPMAEKVLNLIPGDIGRPLSDINPNLELHHLESLVHEVIETMSTRELEARDRHGRAYSVRIRPYKSLENRIDGAVLSIFDVDASMRDKQRIDAALKVAEAVFATVREPMAVVDRDLKIERANAAFGVAFGIRDADAAGVPFLEICGKRQNGTEIVAKLSEVARGQRAYEEVQFECDIVGVGVRSIRLAARHVDCESRESNLTLFAFDGVADLLRKDGESASRP